MPKQKRVRGRQKKNWMEEIRKAMNERNLKEDQLEDRKQWSLGVGKLTTIRVKKINMVWVCNKYGMGM
jgi:hypothetical protein